MGSLSRRLRRTAGLSPMPNVEFDPRNGRRDMPAERRPLPPQPSPEERAAREQERQRLLTDALERTQRERAESGEQADEIARRELDRRVLAIGDESRPEPRRPPAMRTLLAFAALGVLAAEPLPRGRK